MKSNKLVIALVVCCTLSACGGGGGGGGVGGGTGSGGDIGSTIAGANVMAITVNGSLCSDTIGFRYPNKACVSVTVCTPGTASCQTIKDILLDTGSFGLRIFQQALAVPLSTVPSGSGSLAECVEFLDGSSLWGPVQTAGVVLGQEPAVQVPIQVINSTFGTLPTACQDAARAPGDAGFNGILGIGLFEHDCGTRCVNSDTNGMYYTCSGANCSGVKVPLPSQVRNPVALLPQDNNGVIVQLPAVSSSGVASATGSLVLGIGTQSNNTPSGVTAFPANDVGEFNTAFDGVTYSGSFIDSGSNGIFFTPPASTSLATCADGNEKWFCPPSTRSFTATTSSTSGAQKSVQFQIGNFNNLIGTSNNVFNNIGGSITHEFDWGLPFFFGRNVVVGIEGKKSFLGTGPYWAY